MGKKLKMRKDIWDISDVDQQKIADRLYEMEKNSNITSVFDLNSDVSPSVDHNGLSAGLEEMISKDFGNNAKTTEIEDSYKALIPTLDEILSEDDDEDVEEDAGEDYGNQARSTVFKYYEDIRRWCVDDGIAPSSMSVDVAEELDLDGKANTFMKWEDVDSEDYDIPSWDGFIIDMANYITSLKHPTAIFLEKELFEDFGFNRLDGDFSYNTDKFFFLRKAPYIFAWKVDDQSLQGLFNAIDADYEYAALSVKILISMAYSAGAINNAFFAEDNEYIERFRLSKLNEVEAFINDFTSDPKTKFEPEGSDLSFIREIGIDEIETLQSTVRQYITDLTSEPYFGEDEDDDDDDDYDDEDDEDEDEDDDIDVNPISRAINEDREFDKTIIEPKSEVSEAIEKVDKDIEELFNDDSSDDLFDDVEGAEAVTEPEPVKESPSSKPEPVKKEEPKKEVKPSKTSTPSSSASDDDFDDFTIPVIRKK